MHSSVSVGASAWVVCQILSMERHVRLEVSDPRKTPVRHRVRGVGSLCAVRRGAQPRGLETTPSLCNGLVETDSFCAGSVEAGHRHYFALFL